MKFRAPTLYFKKMNDSYDNSFINHWNVMTFEGEDL